MKIKSVAQYHKLHELFPRLAGSWAKETDIKNLPQKIRQGDTLIRYRGKVNINKKGK